MKRWVICISLIGIFSASIFAALSSPAFSTMAIRALLSMSGYPAQIRTGVIHIQRGLKIEANDVSIQIPGGFRLETPRGSLRLHLSGWIAGKRLVSEIRLETPSFYPQKPGTAPRMDFSTLYAAFFSVTGRTGNWPEIIISGGFMRFPGFTVSMETMEIRPADGNPTATLAGWISAEMPTTDPHRFPFRIESVTTRMPESPPSVRIQIQGTHIPLNWIPNQTGIRNISGNASLRMEVSGSEGGPIHISGEVSGESVGFDLIREDRKQRYRPGNVWMAAEVDLTDSDLLLSDLQIQLPEIRLRLTGKVGRSRDGCRPFLVKALAPSMPISTFSEIFPAVLVTPWVSGELIPNLKDGYVDLDHLSVSGSLASSTCRDPASDPTVWDLRLRVRDMTWTIPRLSQPLRQVSAVVSVSGNTLDVTDFSASFLNSRLHTGRYRIPDFGRTYAEMEVHSHLHLADTRILPWESFPPAWDWARELVPKISRLSGTADSRLLLDTQWDPVTVSVRTADARITDLSLSHADLPWPVQLKSGVIRYTNSTTLEYNGQGIWGRFPFSVSGTAAPERRQVVADLELQAGISDLAALPEFGWLRVTDSSGDIACRMKITGSPASWRSEGSADLHHAMLHTPAISFAPPGDANRVDFRLFLDPKGVVHAEEILLRFPESRMTISARYDTTSNRWLRAEIRSPGFSLETLGLTPRQLAMPVSGNIRGELILDNRSKTRPALLEGELHATGIKGMRDSGKGTIRVEEASIHWKDGRTAVENISLDISGNRFRINGDLAGWEQISGTVSIFCPRLKILGAFPENHQTDEIWQDLRERLSDIGARVELGAVETSGMRGGPALGHIRIRNGNIFWDDFRIQLDSGLLRLKGHHRSHPAPHWYLAAYLHVTGWPLPEVLAAVGSEEHRITGDLTADGFFSSRSPSLEQLSRNLSGEARFSIRDGTLYHSSILIRILDWMSLQNLVRFQRTGNPGNQFVFDQLNGNLTLGNEILHLNDVVLYSPVLNAGGQGILNLTDGSVRADIGVKPFGTVDSLVSRIPVIGHILTGDDQSITTYYFETTGKWPRLETRYKPFAQIGPGILGYMERILTTPRRLLDKVFSSPSGSPENHPSEYEIRYEQDSSE